MYLAINVVTSPEATIATAIDATTGREWTGTAKRHPSDKKHVAAIGENLAISRVLRSVARSLEREGQGLVKCEEHNRKHAAQARKEKEERKKNGETLQVYRVPGRKKTYRTN